MAPTTPLQTNNLTLDLENGPHSPSELEKKLFSVLVSYLLSQSQMTAPSTAAQIDSLLKGVDGEASTQVLDRPDPWGFLHIFWDVYFRLGAQIEDSTPMDRLVALASAVKELSTKVASSGDSQDLVCAWKDLPIMGVELSERWHQFDPRNMTPGSEYARRWYNMNDLVARLDVAGVRDSRAQALAAIVIALEDNVNKQKKKHEVPAENVIGSLLPAASVWLGGRDTATKLMRACREGQCRDSGAHGPLWKLGEQGDHGGLSEGGFSVVRWKFWRQRLEDLQKHRCADERTKELCDKMLQAMTEAETG